MDKSTEKLLSTILETVYNISNQLDEHTKILNQHTEILNQHTEMLNQHSDKLISLENTSIEHSQKIQDIENMVTRIELEHGKIIQDIENMVTRIESEHGKRIQNIENIVTRIELEHGEKLKALFDCFTINNEKFIKIDEDISRINAILDRQDDKIFYLDYHKNQRNLPEN